MTYNPLFFENTRFNKDKTCQNSGLAAALFFRWIGSTVRRAERGVLGVPGVPAISA
jgi:hypothetical protein